MQNHDEKRDQRAAEPLLAPVQTGAAGTSSIVAGPPRDAARGHVCEGTDVPLDVTWFRWVDPETGERLRVALGASDAFRQRLAEAGFVAERDAVDRPKRAGDPAAA